MNLKQLARDMRDMSDMLKSYSDELSKMANIDLTPLMVLMGQTTGGGASEPPPFDASEGLPQVVAPAPPWGGEPLLALPLKKHRNHKETTKLTLEQKQQIRNHYFSLQEKDKTIETRRTLAAAYQIQTTTLGAILFNSTDAAQKYRHHLTSATQNSA